ncbi:MAG: bifunctional glutamate N-acetyltransferase/amino-acid acetyltransferase ArgJ [Dehalococcoidia bacterium]|nr:bifunctional glutamate N-acetyltransferase/amino-acid acetyltransferase ArgJ [Dehalococcoidia bacterium]
MSAEQITTIPDGHIASAAGFTTGAIYAGLKTYGKDKLDLGLLYSSTPAAAAGVFTQNKVVSPTITLDRRRLAARSAQAVMVNSGCANACVGPQGMLDAIAMAAIAARKLGIAEELVLVASTGIIGVELPMALLRAKIPLIDLSAAHGHQFARAIMTTDSVPKEAAVRFTMGGKVCTIAGVAKGVGMIHPNMATMLCFVASDAAVEPVHLQDALKSAVDQSLNMVSVDGDSSTNDSCIILANGQAGNPVIRAGTPEAALFEQALAQVLITLAKKIARDGEGATKLLEVIVEGAASLEDARRAARAVTSSPLVKAAVHGADPNWGRVVMALGKSGARMEEDALVVYINDICMMDNGQPVPFFKDAAVVSMREPDVRVRARLGVGQHTATAWGCDLTEEYVRYNSAYTT